MKKTLLSVCLILMLALLGACSKNKQPSTDNTDNTNNTPTVTASVQPTKETQDNPRENTGENALTVKDYYPLLKDTEYIYAGEGNEFAAFSSYVDFIDVEKNRAQIRTANGGTETVKVIEIKDGRLSVIKSVRECYYRDNFLDTTADEQAEILLMEPLTEGTEWMLPNGERRYISAVGVSIDTPFGSYQALEVTTQYKDSEAKDYYAPKVGLVKSIFNPGEEQITSTLSEIKTDAVHTQTITLYYPHSDGKLYTEPVTLSFHTNDITRLVMQEAVCNSVVKEEYLPLASTNTKINSLYLGGDGIVYIDFSPELVTEMNAGAGYEGLILQSITNTLGIYYGADKVYITVDAKPYESGHILMKKGETLKVDLSNVAE